MPLPRLPRIRFGGLPLTACQVAFHTLAYGAMLHAFFSFGWTVKPTWGASMVPTMQVLGDCVLISKHYRRGKDVVVGDLVNYENPFKLGSGVIKRVIGMPGDFVLRDTPHAEGSAGIMIQVGFFSFLFFFLLVGRKGGGLGGKNGRKRTGTERERDGQRLTRYYRFPRATAG